MADMQAWKKTAARNVRKLTPEEAKATIHRVSAQGATINHDDIRQLTGGFVSQNINFAVMRMLGVRAGLVTKR